MEVLRFICSIFKENVWKKTKLTLPFIQSGLAMLCEADWKKLIYIMPNRSEKVVDKVKLSDVKISFSLAAVPVTSILKFL